MTYDVKHRLQTARRRRSASDRPSTQLQLFRAPIKALLIQSRNSRSGDHSYRDGLYPNAAACVPLRAQDLWHGRIRTRDLLVPTERAVVTPHDPLLICITCLSCTIELPSPELSEAIRVKRYSQGHKIGAMAGFELGTSWFPQNVISCCIYVSVMYLYVCHRTTELPSAGLTPRLWADCAASAPASRELGESSRPDRSRVRHKFPANSPGPDCGNHRRPLL
ncbi:hypothetical protein Bbelb_336940 [Branchiostoma belcheri]|nr:hypothetical protein Bbelb_336940 [Branchiostoma belcheri]